MDGKILEDIIHERLMSDKKKGKFFSVGENITYSIGNRDYEIDNVALFVNKRGKKYALVFEDKLGNSHEKKAYQQLIRHYDHLKSKVDKVILFYVHNFKCKNKSYTIQRVMPYKIKAYRR